MKNGIIFFVLVLSLTATAQPFHPYQVKSGHIRYQTTRFILHTETHTGSDGKMVAKAEQKPYLSQTRDYYWDDYGNVARDMIYKVSDRSGKPLPERQKLLERLWRDGRMYYLKNGKVAFDPDHLRNECMEKEQLFQQVGWFKMLYPKAKHLGKEKVAGKKGTRFKVDAFSEFVLWKGLILRNIDYFTDRAGVRKGEQREEAAVKVETNMDFKPGFFAPLWYRTFISSCCITKP